MNFQTSCVAPRQSFVGMPPPSTPSAIDRVVLRHLKTESAIRTVLPLREEIDLSAHLGAGSNFPALEKKETSWGLSAHSS
jgi:hypothetical protein